ncbi:MAG TPA: TIGR04551 family protein [Polyangiaceae bacterium]
MHKAIAVGLIAATAMALASSLTLAQTAPDQPAKPQPAKPAKPPTKPPPETKKPAQPEASDAGTPSTETDAAAAAPAQPEQEAVPESPAQPAPTAPGTLPPRLAPPGAGTLPQATGPARGTKPTAEETRKAAAGGEQVFAEDWWSHARPILELHGYLRVRAELFHNFSLGRRDAPNDAIWPQPYDSAYTAKNDTRYGAQKCTPDEAGRGSNDNPTNVQSCDNRTQAGANMRFRLSPELHISDNLRVLSQFDFLDNLVLGSTPAGYALQPAPAGGYAVRERSPYTPVGALDNTNEPPRSGINTLKDSVAIKRAWGEYATPVGELRFGRMPDHWGLGMLHNSGDGYDDDYQSTIDRIMFVTGIRPLDLYIGGAWDFVNEGATSDTIGVHQGQPYDLGQLDDVDEYALMLFRRKSPELKQLALSRGGIVLNGGLYVVYRKQLLSNDLSGANGDCSRAAALNCTPGNPSIGLERRGMVDWIPDAWFQLLYEKFRFELEAATVQGSVENSLTDGFDYTTAPGGAGWKLRQYGIATEIEQKLVEDRLRLAFNFGWASGDPDTDSLVPRGGKNFDQLGDNTVSTFRFHPSYRVDLILHRYLLTRVQGTYYFKPAVDYDFVRRPDGQRIGGGISGTWSRASEFIQTPGHARDLGVELNGSLYFQSKDGALNDIPGEMGGFFTMLQYGVLFPFGGLKYQRAEKCSGQACPDVNTPQILRWYIGVFF